MASNAPNRFETFLLEEGQKKVVIQKDTKVPNGAILTVNKEDYTLANLLRDQLLKDERVKFAGCLCPHPLVSQFVLRVQTTSDCTPYEAVQNAITQLLNTLAFLEERFKEEVKERQDTIG